MSTVARALLTVFDKTDLKELGVGLKALGVELLATGGTATELEAAGCQVVRTETLTGFAELLDGRVKTLHPAIHAGILARREVTGHLDQLQQAGFSPIDLVVVNLYPFEQTITKAGVTLEEAVEMLHHVEGRSFFFEARHQLVVHHIGYQGSRDAMPADIEESHRDVILIVYMQAQMIAPDLDQRLKPIIQTQLGSINRLGQNGFLNLASQPQISIHLLLLLFDLAFQAHSVQHAFHHL